MQNLEIVMLLRGIRARELAETLGVTIDTVGRWCRDDEIVPHRAQREALEEVLGVSWRLLADPRLGAWLLDALVRIDKRGAP